MIKMKGGVHYSIIFLQQGISRLMWTLRAINYQNANVFQLNYVVLGASSILYLFHHRSACLGISISRKTLISLIMRNLNMLASSHRERERENPTKWKLMSYFSITVCTLLFVLVPFRNMHTNPSHLVYEITGSELGSCLSGDFLLSVKKGAIKIVAWF